MNEQEVITLHDLIKWGQDWMHTCGINHVDPKDVPFYIENKNRRYRPFSGSLGFGNKGVSVRIEYFDSDIVRFDPKDERPEGGGEYWKSRGASDSDVSGFVASRAAGLRLLRMVRYVLDTDEPIGYRIGFAHRPDPNGWDGKNVLTGEVSHYTPKVYGKGGWNGEISLWMKKPPLPKEYDIY